jgi:hypothetical protein
MKKNESSWRDRFDMLKQEHDKTLIELMEIKKRYNELLDIFRKRGEELVERQKDYLNLYRKYNSLLSTTESNE